MKLFDYVKILEKEEYIISEKKPVIKYTEEDIEEIKVLLRKGKQIKDQRLLEIYNKLKIAGIFE